MEDRRELAQGREIWVIKAGFPNTPAGKNWSDYVFAHSLKKYLERQGHYVLVESFDEWDNGLAADTVVVLRGLKRYFPDRAFAGRVYIMWNLSHPDDVTEEEYNSYDLVCTSSGPYGRKLAGRVKVPVKLLPMCADTEIFYPGSDAAGEKEYVWIFVGNSRNMERKCVAWAIKHGLPLKIWGANWKKFIPGSERYVVAENMPNSQLPELYRNAKATVCDHYEDMIKNGFINTRIVESFACGLPVLSDYSEVLGELFGDAILCYRDEAEFVEQANRLDREYGKIREKVRALWPVIQEKYSFEACARQLCAFAGEIREYGEACARQVEELTEAARTARESEACAENGESEACAENVEGAACAESGESEACAENAEGAACAESGESKACAENAGGAACAESRESKACGSGAAQEQDNIQEPNGIGRTYRRFCELIHMAGPDGAYGTLTDEAYGTLTAALESLQQEYGGLTWREQQAFTRLKGRERLLFELCMQYRPGASSSSRELYEAQEEAKRLKQENEQLSGSLRKLSGERSEAERRLKAAYGAKEEINGKLKEAYREKSEINRKLQATYKEKSEINRKLQVTYGEKYDRGLRIKSLEKELAAVKGSRTYRLARLIGSPVRFLRKLMKKAKE